MDEERPNHQNTDNYSSMNDTRILCNNGHVHSSSRVINEGWDYVSFRLQSTADGFYAEVDYPRKWVLSFLSWVYTRNVPAYETLDIYTGMLLMAADSMKYELFKSLEAVLVEWKIKSGTEAILIWERASKASSARVQNFLVEFVQSDPLLVFADAGFYHLPAEMRSLLCKRVSDGRKIKSKKSIYHKNEESDEEEDELYGLTVDGLRITPLGSIVSMSSTMSAIRTPKSKVIEDSPPRDTPHATKHKKAPSEPIGMPSIIEPKLWNLPFSSYNPNCKKVPEEIVLRLREDVRLAAEARIKAKEEEEAKEKAEIEAETNQ